MENGLSYTVGWSQHRQQLTRLAFIGYQIQPSLVFKMKILTVIMTEWYLDDWMIIMGLMKVIDDKYHDW